jgi:hypothetical protein
LFPLIACIATILIWFERIARKCETIVSLKGKNRLESNINTNFCQRLIARLHIATFVAAEIASALTRVYERIAFIRVVLVSTRYDDRKSANFRAMNAANGRTMNTA